MQVSGAERAEDGIRELNRQIRDHRMKSTIEIRNMRLREENKLGSMQNYKTVRKLNGMIVVRLTTLAKHIVTTPAVSEGHSGDWNVVQELSLFRKWWSLCEREEIRDFLEFRACSVKAIWSGISHEIFYCLKPDPSWRCNNWVSQTELYKNQVYSITLKGWNFAPGESVADHSKREKNWLSTELDRRENVLLEDRIRGLQKTEELEKCCCAEAERAKQLRIDELCIQEKQSIYSELLYCSNSGITRQREFSERFQRILWSWNGKQFWVVSRCQSACEYSESSWNA